jgi:hypothetical protein
MCITSEKWSSVSISIVEIDFIYAIKEKRISDDINILGKIRKLYVFVCKITSK